MQNIINPVLINASLVSAQNRKRLFWVSKLQQDGTYKQVEISQPEDKGILLKDILESDVDEKFYIKNERKNTMVSNRPQENIGGGKGAKTGLYLTNSKGKTHQQELLQKISGKCRTIPAGTHGSTPHLLKTIMEDNSIRKLTPVECLRLQSMPDDFFDNAICKNRLISNTQRYKMCGNAFNKEVIVHILKQLDL